MLTDTLSVSVEDFSRRTGWDLKSEGACKGAVCVPLPDGSVRAGRVDIPSVANRLGMPVIRHGGEQLWAVGPESGITGRALTTELAPEIELPDLRTGAPFRLSSLRGQKVLLVAWASW